MINFIKIYDKTNFFTSYAIVNLTNILNYSILNNMSNRIINYNYGIKNFEFC